MIKKIFLLATITGMFFLAGYIDQHYSMEGTVISENIIVDAIGDEWEMDSTIPYRDGETVKIHFNNNCTLTREDDIITKISLKK